MSTPSPLPKGLELNLTGNRLKITYALGTRQPRLRTYISAIVTLLLLLILLATWLAYPVDKYPGPTSDYLTGLLTFLGYLSACSALVNFALLVSHFEKLSLIVTPAGVDIVRTTGNCLIPSADIRSVVSSQLGANPDKSTLDIVVPTGTLRLTTDLPAEVAAVIVQQLSQYFPSATDAQPPPEPIAELNLPYGFHRIVLVACGIVACFVVPYFASCIHDALAMWTWPSTTATVIQQHYEKRDDRVVADLTYTYVVNGQTHQSDQVSRVLDRSTYADLVANHPSGSTLPAYYNPDHPSDSVLMRGVSSVFWLLTFLSIPGALMLLYLFHWPTAAHTALRRRYHQPPGSGPVSALEIEAQWTIPDDIQKHNQSRVRKEFFWICTRTSIAMFAVAAGASWWVHDIVEPRVLYVVWAIPTVFSVLLYLCILGLLVPVRQRPIRLAADANIYYGDHRRLRLSSVVGYEVAVRSIPRPHRQLVLHRKLYGPEEFTLPDGPQAQTIIDIIARHVPLLTDPPKRLPAFTWVDTIFFLLFPIAFGIVSSWYRPSRFDFHWVDILGLIVSMAIALAASRIVRKNRYPDHHIFAVVISPMVFLFVALISRR